MLKIPENIEISFTAKLTEEGIDFFQQLPSFPDKCPSCGFSHDSKLWVRKGDIFECDNCRYILQESEIWHSIIEP
jgi:rubredoxin